MKVFILANDRYILHLLRFLASAALFAPQFAITLIPFNEDFSLCRRVAEVFGATIYDGDLQTIDDFGRKLFDEKNTPQPPNPYALGKVRKLVILAASEPSLYLDLDLILTNDFRPICDWLQTSKYGFAYYSISRDWVYNDSDAGKELAAASNLFATGFLAKGRIELSLASICDKLLQAKEQFHRVRKVGVVDQPLFNFLADHLGVGPVHNIQKTLGLSAAVIPREGAHVRGDWSAWHKGLPVPFIHQPGDFRNDRRCRFLFDGMLAEGYKRITKSDPELLRVLRQREVWTWRRMLNQIQT